MFFYLNWINVLHVCVESCLIRVNQLIQNKEHYYYVLINVLLFELNNIRFSFSLFTSVQNQLIQNKEH